MNPKLLRFTASTKSNLLTSGELTDIFEEIPVSIPPGKKICLVTDVCIDGIGDLIHQIRAFEVLNKVFPGQVDCYTYCAPIHLPAVQKAAQDYHFQTQYNPENIDEEKYALAIDVSYQMRWSAKSIKSFKLLEINQPSFKSDTEEFMGLLPHGVGMWSDGIPISSNQSALLSNNSRLKNMFGCAELNESSQIQNWLDHAWIAQSFEYSQDLFMTTLLAQLEYIKIKQLPIEHFFIKFHGKERNKNKAWDIEAMMSNTQFLNALSELGVGNVTINNKRYLINEKNSLEVNMSSQRISQEDYPVFQQLINGAIFPSGDNSYSEAWSNPNTLLPPFLGLRNFKKHLLFQLVEILKDADLEPDAAAWLTTVSKLNIELNHKDDNDYLDIFKDSHALAQTWAEIDMPQQAWLALYEKLKEHDLNRRLPSVIKEQLLFLAHPELAKQKETFRNDLSREKAVEAYAGLVEATIVTDAKPTARDV